MYFSMILHDNLEMIMAGVNICEKNYFVEWYMFTMN